MRLLKKRNGSHPMVEPGWASIGPILLLLSEYFFSRDLLKRKRCINSMWCEPLRVSCYSSNRDAVIVSQNQDQYQYLYEAIQYQ